MAAARAVEATEVRAADLGVGRVEEESVAAVKGRAGKAGVEMDEAAMERAVMEREAAEAGREMAAEAGWEMAEEAGWEMAEEEGLGTSTDPGVLPNRLCRHQG